MVKFRIQLIRVDLGEQVAGEISLMRAVFVVIDHDVGCNLDV
jgi:hypothetical protein